MIRIDFDYLERHFPRRPCDAHKGTMGTLVSLTGSFGFAGAAVLSAKAALRSGVGLHYQVLPESIYPLFGGTVHESVCVPVKGNDIGTLCKADIPAISAILEKATAILIGCGMGNNDATAQVLKAVLSTAKCPVIIDADGINVLSQHIHEIDDCKAPIILTPHVKEFSRLTGLSVADILKAPAKVAEEYIMAHRDITLVLKGHLALSRAKFPVGTTGVQL
ncbi:MAG: hypothetical protein II163_03930, partial [Ruminococcus sp.]|nr:hypothetical protein [Ruminococcus sp.]